MKYTIKKVHDELPMSADNAYKMAEKQLKETNYFAAVYGRRLNEKIEFFTPILVDEESLKQMAKELSEKDDDSRLYVVYKEDPSLDVSKDFVEDEPLYSIEYRPGEAWIDIPDEEIEEFIKQRLIQIANNPRLIGKYRSDLEDMLEDELQAYAEDQFYNKQRGKIYKDEDIKEA